MSSSRPESIEDLFQILVEKGDSEYGDDTVRARMHQQIQNTTRVLDAVSVFQTRVSA